VAYVDDTLVAGEALVAKDQMTAEVAARLDPAKCYGIWWFNRRKTKTYQEAVNGPEGKRYKKRVKVTRRPEEEWIAVPVPESSITARVGGLGARGYRE
jgi:hypothetical protein